MRRWRCAILAVACGLLLAATVAAHHSFGAEYDVNQPITITGMVTTIDWRNPHTFFYLDVTDKDGRTVNWKLEGYGPGVLSRLGWKKDVTMKPGDRITVTGWRARDGSAARGIHLRREQSRSRPLREAARTGREDQPMREL